MSEKFEGFKEEPTFEVGMLVRLKDDLEGSILSSLSSVIEPNVTYKIHFLKHDPDGGPTLAYIGPVELDSSSIDEEEVFYRDNNYNIWYCFAFFTPHVW